jgi:hypothetical protein
VKLEKISYRKLDSKQKEIYNFQKVAGLLADYGFTCIKLADDWKGADFLAYRKDDNITLKVQLKSRITIAEKYSKKSLYMAFPIRKGKVKNWYLIEYDKLVRLVKKHCPWLEKNRRNYSSTNANKKLTSSLAKSTIGEVEETK